MSEKVYEMIWEEGTDLAGVFGISPVENPANGFEVVTMKEAEELQLSKEVNSEKRLLAGVVLQPKQKIRRVNKDTNEEYYLTFSEEVIEKLAHNFLAKQYTDGWFNHDGEKIDINIVESWVLKDSNKDKAITLGFDNLEQGTWMLIMKLSKEHWDKYVKTGKVKGFSIDGFLDKIPVQMSENQLDVNKKDMNMFLIENKTYMSKLFDKFVKFVSDEGVEEDVKLMTIKSGENTLEVEALEKGKVVNKGSEPFADGEFTYEGKVYKTNSSGAISSIEDVVETKEEEVEMTDEEKKEKVKMFLSKMIDEDESIREFVKQMVEDKDEDKVKMSIQLAKEKKDVKDQFKVLFSKELKSKDAEIAKLKAELENTPASTKLKASGGKVEFSENESYISRLSKIVESNK